MKIFNSTDRWVKWWANRKIDWNEHYMNPNHPHRGAIAEVLSFIPWLSLIELGSGAGANLFRIAKTFPGRQLGGIDINPDAIDLANKTFKHGLFKVGPIDDVMLSGKSVDVILSDMVYIYITPDKMAKHLAEVHRLARNYVVFCELHSESWWNRFAVKWNEGYNVYDWKKLLAKHGFCDIIAYKITKDSWPESDLQQQFCHIIIARVLKHY